MILVGIALAQLGIVQFATRAYPDTVYAGQQVTYEAVTLVDAMARSQLVRNPRYTPPEVTGATVYDFPFDLRTVHDTVVGGTSFRVFTYRRAIFPLTPGVYRFPAATLTYAMSGTGAPGEAVPVTTLAGTLDSIVARPLPLSGQPVGFAGPVGTFRDTMWIATATPRVGDTFTLTVRVAGVGNLDLLPRPALRIDWANVVPAAERVAWDSAGTVVRGTKEFDWVVTPRLAGEMVIPEVRYPYFDPAARSYVVASTPPLRIAVAAAGGAAKTVQPIALDTLPDTPFPALTATLRRHAVAIAVAGLVIAVIVLVAITRRRGGDYGED